MNVFFIGYASAGKSPMIQFIKERLEANKKIVKVVYCGGWVAEKLGLPKDLSGGLNHEHRSKMTEETKRILAEDPMAPINWMRKEASGYPLVLFDGIRNPNDLAHLYKPGDIFIIISRYGYNGATKGVYPKNNFENIGVESTKSYAGFADCFLGGCMLEITIPAGTLFTEEHIAIVYEEILNGLRREYGQ